MSRNPSSLPPSEIMHRAIASAKLAVSVGEVPIAAILLDAAGNTLATAHNQVETTQNPLAHAEMLVLTEALKQRRYFEDCTLAVTLEPCAMCMAALCHARIGTVLFGAYDPKSGGVDNGARIFNATSCHYVPEVYGGIMERECAELLVGFFKGLR